MSIQAIVGSYDIAVTENAQEIAVTLSPSAVSPGVTNHGDLSGLSDDDHPQYLLATALPTSIFGGDFGDVTPPTAGDNGYAFVWNHALGRAVWTAMSGGGTPGGSTTQVQYNNGGAFAGDAGLTYDPATDALTVVGRVVTPIIRPASDSTDATGFNTAAGVRVFTVDTVNLGVSAASFVAAGTSPATAGAFRAPNNVAIVWRNAANNGNVSGFLLNTSNEFYCGNGALILFSAGGAPTMYVTNNNGLVNIGNGTNFPSSTDGKFFVKGGSDIRQFVVRGHTTQNANLTELQNSGSAIQFAIGGDGKLKTNQAVTNTNTPSGATAKAMPIYDASGTLLGYTPLYASLW